jgi:medium-chain acyl-[acyl-carrier-protein] hydrolase
VPIYSNLEIDTWIRRKARVPNPRVRIFCFPHAGGGASLYRLWHKYLPPTVEVCPVQLPGREGRIQEEPFTDLSILVKVISELIYPLLDRPFVFFGHSMGGLIAYELTHSIWKKYKQSPALLIVAALTAPNDPIQPPVVHKLPQGEFLNYIKQLQGTPEEVLNNGRLIDFFIPLLRADFTLYETYTLKRDVSLFCPIAVYGGLEDNSVSEKSLDLWEYLTVGKFIKRMFPGNHYFIRENSDYLFQALLEDLSPLLV